MNLVSEKLAKAKKITLLFFSSLKTLKDSILLSNTVVFTKGNLRELRGRSMPFFFPCDL